MRAIVQDGAPVLRETAQPLPERLFGSSELALLIDEMTLALDKEPEGVALAAPQIGVSYRLFIVRHDRTIAPPLSGEPSHVPDVEVYINPEIIKTSRKRGRTDEGCLSVRGIYGVTNRHERVSVRARRPDGTHFERGASGILAQIFEHEIDHLNGILFIDHAENMIQLTRDHDA